MIDTMNAPIVILADSLLGWMISLEQLIKTGEGNIPRGDEPIIDKSTHKDEERLQTRKRHKMDTRTH